MANQDVRLPAATGRGAPFVRTALTVLLFAAAFFVVQRLTFSLRFPPYQRTTIWTPGALFFSALLLAPPRRWWVYYTGLCLGAFAAYYGDRAIPVTSAMLAAQFHFGAVALAAWGIRRFGPSPPFESLYSLLVFVAAAIVLIPVITTAPVDLVRFIAGADDVWPVVLRSLLCVALGMLIATPALTLTVANGPVWLRTGSWARYMEIASLAAGLAAVGRFCFEEPSGTTAAAALFYAPLPLLLWAAARFELAGVSWALLLLGYQSTWGAAHGRGPFTNQSPSDNVLQIQLFLLTISLPLMFLAAAIQERRLAFSALSHSELEVRRQYAQLASIYHTAPVGIAFLDTQLRFVSINDCLAEINGRPAAAHLGRTLRQVLPNLADTLEPVYQRVIRTGQPIVDVEIHGSTASQPDADRVWLMSHHPVKDQDGLVLGVNTLVQEITDRHRVEETKQTLIHASRLTIVGELTASIAHEINQPLGAILSNSDAAEMLLESSPPPLDEVRQILDDIRKDDLRASEVIRRMRGLLSNREMELQPIDLNGVISEVLYLVQAESRRRGVALETDLADGLPVVRGDRVHLQQVLLNLFLNGMDAMADVFGAKRLIVRTASKETGRVEIAVGDTGTGIPADRLPRLFSPFFSTKQEGMGLGLSIARSLVEAHGGRIWAENNPRGGATFRFTVPAESEQPSRESRKMEGTPVETSV